MTESVVAVRKFKKVCDILDVYNRNPEKLIPILQKVQDEYRYLPEEVLTFVATSLGISPAKVYGVATFYSHFALEPKGKHIIRLCDGTACHVKNSTGIKEVIKKKLGLTDKTFSTPDMLFTLEIVSCLGACGLAPVMVINDKVYGQMTPEKALEILGGIIAEEAAR